MPREVTLSAMVILLQNRSEVVTSSSTMRDPRLPPASAMEEAFAVKCRAWPSSLSSLSPSTTESPSTKRALPAGSPLRCVKLRSMTSLKRAPLSAPTPQPTRSAKNPLQNSIEPSGPVTMIAAGMAFMIRSLYALRTLI